MPVKKKVKINPKLPEDFSIKEVLTDLTGKQWTIGAKLGTGGFGVIYNAKSNEQKEINYVAKIEPFTNGPLFTEIHFYHRCCKKEQIDEWIEKHSNEKPSPKSLAIPIFIGCGNHVHTISKSKYRFLIMEKFGLDLEHSVFGTLSQYKDLRVFICNLAIRLLFALEYIHDKGYVHSDIKASNLLPGLSKTDKKQIFLLDYGLVSRYLDGTHHKSYKVDRKKCHDGTLELTSIDCHEGADPSRRSDLQILGFNLLKWSAGRLPWEPSGKSVANLQPDKVMKEKISYMKDIPALMKAAFKTKPIPSEIEKYFNYIKTLAYDTKPDYQYLRRDVFEATLKQEFGKLYDDNFFDEKVLLLNNNATPKSVKRLKTTPEMVKPQSMLKFKDRSHDSNNINQAKNMNKIKKTVVVQSQSRIPTHKSLASTKQYNLRSSPQLFNDLDTLISTNVPSEFSSPPKKITINALAKPQPRIIPKLNNNDKLPYKPENNIIPGIGGTKKPVVLTKNKNGKLATITTSVKTILPPIFSNKILDDPCVKTATKSTLIIPPGKNKINQGDSFDSSMLKPLPTFYHTPALIGKKSSNISSVSTLKKPNILEQTRYLTPPEERSFMYEKFNVAKPPSSSHKKLPLFYTASKQNAARNGTSNRNHYIDLYRNGFDDSILR